MGYSKVYYDDIWEITSKGSIKCKEWMDSLKNLSEKISAFNGDNSIEGDAAESMKLYMNEVHMSLLSILSSLLMAYYAKASSYYAGYENSVDSGDGSKHGLRYTTIVAGEVKKTGTVYNRLNAVINEIDEVSSAANSVKHSVSSIVAISASPNGESLKNQIRYAQRHATNLDNRVNSYEASHARDLEAIERLIAQAQQIINYQMGDSRIPPTAYPSGGIGAMCDIKSLVSDLDACRKIYDEFEKSGLKDRAEELAFNREAMIQQEAEDSREWAHWAAIGVAVIGGIAVTIATAGAAGPGVVIAVGAIAGGTAAAANSLADEYVKNGNLDNMDWGKFGKDVFVGSVVGGVSAYLGTLSPGSALKQPVEKALFSAGKSIAIEGTRGVANTIWDVGDAIVSGRFEDIGSVIKNDFTETAKSIVVNGAEDFVAGYIGGKFSVDTSEKGYGRRVWETIAKGAGKEGAGFITETLWDVGASVMDPESSKNLGSTIYDNFKERLGNTAKVIGGGLISGIKIDPKNSWGKIAVGTVQDTAEDTVGRVSKGVTERSIDVVAGLEDSDNILGDIWEKDLEKGQTIGESAASSFLKNTHDEFKKDKIFKDNLRKLDVDRDGNIDVVHVGDYTFTKEDYDTALANADKGAYKGKSAQDLLGLPKDADLRKAKTESVSIDNITKYKSSRKTTDTVTVDGKYHYRKEYYESVQRAAGKGEYKGQSAQEMLDMPEDTVISKDSVEYKRVRNEDIGLGKKVELTSDNKSNATRIHVKGRK